MKIEIDLDLAGIIASATSTEKLQPLVDKAVSEALKSAISDATGYNSEFRKALTEQLKTAMPHGLSIAEAAKFQLMANTAVTEMVQGANAETLRTAITKGLEGVLPDVPDSIKLSELLEMARGGLHKERHEGFYARLEVTSYGFAHIYIDSDEGCRHQYQAKTQIDVSKDGNVYNMKLDGQPLKQRSLPTVIGCWEGTLLAMYVGRTELVIDMDADEVEYAAGPKED